MPTRIVNQLVFRLERLLLRGPQYRLLLIAALIGLISILAGTLVYLFDPAFRGLGFPDAVWWSFLRLTDPGYLGDDTGAFERTVSTVLTVLGYVIFLGALVAIMTQWLHERLRELEAGLTPIAQSGHVLIIGWTNRTPTIVSELVLSGARLRRFLERRRTRTLRIAILAEQVTSALQLELRDRLGALWKERQIVLRTGSPLRIEHLQRVDFIHAAAVIMPATDAGEGGPDHADARTIKTLLGMSNHPRAAEGELPLAVAEIFDSRRIAIARGAYLGPIEILASDAIVGRLIAQNLRHAGLSYVYGDLLTHGRGSELYVRDAGELEGYSVHAATHAFPGATLLGTVRPHGDSFDTVLNPPAGTRINAGDRLVLLAASFEATNLDISRLTSGVIRAVPPAPAQQPRHAPAERSILVLGWNHKVPALLRELDSYERETFRVQVVSLVPVAERETALRRFGLEPQRVLLDHVEDDYTIPGILARCEPASFDNVLLLGSDRLASGEESDARSVLAYLLLREMLPEKGGPSVLVELLDAGNVGLFHGRRAEVIVSPVLVSHMMVQVALRRELRAVFDVLYGPAGAEMVFRAATDYVPAGRMQFSEVVSAAAARGQVALGVRPYGEHASGRANITLNPASDRMFDFGAGDEIILLT